MKIVVVGAAGKTGRAVVERALAGGHQVTAFVHTERSLDMPGVTVIAGDARDAAVMDAVIAGQHAVIDTVGGKTPYRRTTLEAGVVAAIVAAMRRHEVRRLIVTSTVGEGDSIANAPFVVRVLLRTFLRGATADKAELESTVRASDLDWVITRPAVLTEKPAIGNVRIFSSDERERARSITRSDLATFLVAQLTSDEFLGRAVTIAN